MLNVRKEKWNEVLNFQPLLCMKKINELMKLTPNTDACDQADVQLLDHGSFLWL